MMSQNGASGGDDDDVNALMYSADVLFEKEMSGSGTLDLEVAYYNFEEAGQGSSFVGLASYLFPGKQGFGTIQPMIRLQQRMLPDIIDLTGTVANIGVDSQTTIDGALNYIINGHNARLTLNYQHQGSVEASGIELAPANDIITFGGQLQL